MITFWRVKANIISFSGPRLEVMGVKSTIKAMPGKVQVWTWGHIPTIDRLNGGAMLPEYLTAFFPPVGEEWTSKEFIVPPPPPYSAPPTPHSTEGEACESVRARELPEFAQGKPGTIRKGWIVCCPRCHVTQSSRPDDYCKIQFLGHLLESGWRTISTRYLDKPPRWACPQCLGILRKEEWEEWKKTQ